MCECMVNSGIDLVNVLAVLVAGGIGAFSTWFVGNRSNKIQKDLWQKDAFLKYECEIITATKRKYQEIYKYIYEFESLYISPLSLIKSTNKTEIIKLNKYDYFIKPFTELYDYYIHNRQIFIKYNLEDNFEVIGFYLHLLKAIKQFKKITYVPCKEETIINLNTNSNEIGYRAEIWYIFPFLTHHYLYGGGLILNPSPQYCRENFNKEIYDEYKEIYFTNKKAVQEIDTILSKIMSISDFKEDVLPSYVATISLDYYKKNRKS